MPSAYQVVMAIAYTYSTHPADIEQHEHRIGGVFGHLTNIIIKFTCPLTQV